MGWNSLEGALPAAMFGGLGPAPHMYFTHSFAFYPAWADDVAASTDHGGRFAGGGDAGQCGRRAVPPGKVARRWRCACSPTSLEWRP